MKKILAALFVLFCAPAAAQNYLRDDGIFHSVVEGTTNGQVLVNTNGLLAGISSVPLVVGNTPITGGTTTAPLFNNAGVLGNGSISSIWSTFTQTGTGATSTTFDALYRTKIYTPEMFGAACNGSDAGPAIQRAVNAVGSLTLGPGAVRLAPCAYTVVTPVVDSYGVRLLGANAGGTFFVFAPTSGGQIAYRVRNAGSIVASGGIEDVFFYTNDTTRIKVAIEVEDISHYTIKNVRISGSTAGLAALWGGGGSSIGLRTRGREFLWVDGLQSYAEIPIEIAKNPNSANDADYFDIRNVTVVASSANNGITIDDGLALTRNNFSSISINGGTNCIYWINTTGIIPSDGNTLDNIGCEQGTAGGYNYVFEGNATGLIRNLTLSGFHLLDGVRNGPILRSIENLNISGSVFYQGVSPLLCMDVNSTVRGMSWRNSKFQNCSLASFSGQNLTSGAALNSGQVLPVWANYASSSDDSSLVSTSITSPLHIGGSGTTGTQSTLQTTTGNGTTDAFAFKGGNNGATTFATMASSGFTLTALQSDTAMTDASLCARTSDNLVLKGTGTLGICLGTSGAQFKSAFTPMVGSVDDISRLNFQNYRYREGFGDGGARVQYGLTAQDVEAVLPDLVRHNEKGEAINYDSGALLFIGLRAIQQLKAGNDNIESRLAKLEQAQARIKELEADTEEKKVSVLPKPKWLGNEKLEYRNGVPGFMKNGVFLYAGITPCSPTSKSGVVFEGKCVGGDDPLNEYQRPAEEKK